LALSAVAWAQQPQDSVPPKTPPASSTPAKTSAPNQIPSAQTPSNQTPANEPQSNQTPSGEPQSFPFPGDELPPNQAPPGSDHVNIQELDRGNAVGESSSKDTQIDVSPPPDDAATHPQSADAIAAEEEELDATGVQEFHPWDPHKAAKDVEVGDYYFKLKNYRGAEDRYREALLYKSNDALATYRLAVCLEKMGQVEEARQDYEAYLKILPHGEFAKEAEKALARLKPAEPAGK